MTRHGAQRAVIAGLVVAYVAIWGASSVVLRHTSDLDVFFWPAAETAAHGHPLLIYSTNTFGQGSNDNGPLGLTPLVPLAAVANRMGWARDVGLRTAITDAVFATFALLLATSAVRIIARARGALEWRLAAPCVFLLAPALWISVGAYGHLEQPIELWFVLLAVGYAARRRSIAAGVALGLAILTRTTAMVYLIPFALLPLAGRRITPTARVLSVSALVAATGFAPFFFADGPSVVHSLVTYRGDLQIAGGSFWLVARNTAWAAVVEHGDMHLIVALVAGLTSVIIWLRPNQATTTVGIFGLLTVAGACFPMLAKTTYPYYFLEPYVFAAIWWLARPGAALNWRFAVPLLLTADAFLSKWGANLPFTGLGVVEGVAASTILALVIVLVVGDLLSGRANLELPAGDHPFEQANARRVNA